MSGPLYLAWCYVARHRAKTAILVTAIALIVFLPVGLQVLVGQSARELTARAESTPLLVGARDVFLEELIDLVSQDAVALGCTSEVERARTIAADGTSADRQIAVFEKALAGDADEAAALAAVVDHLVAETLEGCEAG